MKRELRPHQERALAMLRDSLAAGRRRPMLGLPTGAGKTVIAAAIGEGVLRKDRRMLFTVPALSLVDQTVRAFWEEGIRDVGVIQGSHAQTDWSRPVQVASVQTLARRPMPNADIALVDEAHKWFTSFEPWFADPAWLGKPIVGLSATPWAKGLGTRYDDLLIAATTSGLIDDGYLAPFRVFAPSHPDLSGVSIARGDYHEGELAEAMAKPQLVADVVETWLTRGEDRPTLVFAVDRAHARHLEERFGEAGVSVAYVDANTDGEEREAIRKRFHDGDVRVVCNIGTLTVGVDWDVRCIVLARPTRSQMLFVQIVGRGLRTAAGKQDLLILDHSDNHLRLGFVTDIHHDRLDDGTRREADIIGGERKPSLPKECPSCSRLKPAGMQVCPSCGFKPEKRSAIEVQDGDLVELDPVDRKARTKAEPDRATKQRFWSMVLGTAEERGKSRGWALATYKNKFGVWPRGLTDDVLPAEGDVLAYIRSRQIAYAKSKSRAAA